MKLLAWLCVNVLALLFAIWLFPGITLHGSSTGDRVIQLVITGAIFGVITSLVKPLLKVLTCPLIILTLGLFLLVINAVLLWATSRIAGALDLGFHVHGFWTTVLGGIVISVASMVLEAVIPDGDD